MLDYTSDERSFSPHFSNVGLEFGPRSGIEKLVLHYNRVTYTLAAPFVSLDQGGDIRMSPLIVRHKQDDGSSQATAFFGYNAWLFESAGPCPATVTLNENAPGSDCVLMAAGPRIWILRRYVPTADPRDPDRFFPVRIALKVIRGRVQSVRNAVFTIAPDRSGKMLLAFGVNVLDINEKALLESLNHCPVSAEEALRRSRSWLTATLHRLPMPKAEAQEFPIAARAALSLAMNATLSPGQLRKRIAIFPNRGRYACPFLWDSCFQNLATEHMLPRLASDSLLVLIENQRADGMLAHFLCSTWQRPDTSQPPLVGWAAVRLVKQRRDRRLARAFLEALEKNVQWWLTQRGSPEGLIICRDPFETGWDDTPRLDKGPILALDMSSYVLNQKRACAELARFLGQKAKADQWEEKAARMARTLVKQCYDPETNLFYDVLLSTAKFLPLKTPAAFLPLWAGVPLSADRQRKMIRNWLLNPDYFYDRVPFPSVAYDEPCYDAGKWWRGPSWPSIAYLLIELLEQQGFQQEALVSRQRLLELWMHDGHLRELFNSQTGEGLGSFELGWTAAIFLKLHSQSR